MNMDEAHIINIFPRMSRMRRYTSFSSSGSLSALMAKMKEEEHANEERMSLYYNFDFRNNMPFNSPVAADTAVHCRFVWEPVAAPLNAPSPAAPRKGSRADVSDTKFDGGKIMAGFFRRGLGKVQTRCIAGSERTDAGRKRAGGVGTRLLKKTRKGKLVVRKAIKKRGKR